MANEEFSASAADDRTPSDDGPVWWTSGKFGVGALGLAAPLILGLANDRSALVMVLGMLVAAAAGAVIGFAVHRDHRAKALGGGPARFTAGLVSLGACAWFAAWLVPTFFFDGADAPTAEALTAPEGAPTELTECERVEAEVGVLVTRVVSDTQPCTILEYVVDGPTVAFFTISRSAGDAGMFVNALGPNGRNLGNDTLAPTGTSIVQTVGLPRAGTYQFVIGRNTDGSAGARATLNLRPAAELQAGSSERGFLTPDKPDAYVIDLDDGMDVELTIDTATEADIDIEVTGPIGFAAAAGSPPLQFPVVDRGAHFVVVSSVSTWRGSYDIGLGDMGASPPPPSTTEPTGGLPRSLVGSEALTVRDELISAGFTPRIIEVCSSSVGAGFVRQIVEEQLVGDEITELVLDDTDGLTTAGEEMAPASNVVVKVSTGNACGATNWVVVVGSDESLDAALDEVERADGTEFEGRVRVYHRTLYQTAVTGFESEDAARNEAATLTELFPFAGTPSVEDVTSWCVDPTPVDDVLTECGGS